jgi:hypothetical protein
MLAISGTMKLEMERHHRNRGLEHNKNNNANSNCMSRATHATCDAPGFLRPMRACAGRLRDDDSPNAQTIDPVEQEDSGGKRRQALVQSSTTGHYTASARVATVMPLAIAARFRPPRLAS